MKELNKKLPLTWLVNEILSIVLLVACIFHALAQPEPVIQLFLLLCFIFGAAVFEHVGVLITHTYSYDAHRIMLCGKLPLSILLIEAEIVYVGMILFSYLHMPAWTSIWVVGLFSVFYDFSIDPVYVYDQYPLDGSMSGQWNWVKKYEGGYVGIPYMNFTGWIYMTGFYAGLYYLFGFLAEVISSRFLALASPFLAGLLLIVPIMLAGGRLIHGGNTHDGELRKLVLGCLFPLVLMLIYHSRWETIDWSRDWILWLVPLVLYGYDVAVMFLRKIRKAYIPVFVCMVLHAVFYLYLTFAI